MAWLADRSGDNLAAARSEFASQVAFLSEIYETHRLYPVLRYFRYRQPYYALPQLLLTSLDAASRAAAGSSAIGAATNPVRWPPTTSSGRRAISWAS